VPPVTVDMPGDLK